MLLLSFPVQGSQKTIVCIKRFVLKVEVPNLFKLSCFGSKMRHMLSLAVYEQNGSTCYIKLAEPFNGKNFN
jgi:hypothetical protein